MKTKRFILHGGTQRQAAIDAVRAAESGQIVTVSSANRTTEQNALIHKWFSQIAIQKGDESMLDIKAHCNLIYGRPIKVRDDPEWEAVFGYLFDRLNYDKKIKAIRILDVPFTRSMNVDQLSEYMTNMARDYRQEGFSLVDPEELRLRDPQREYA